MVFSSASFSSIPAAIMVVLCEIRAGFLLLSQNNYDVIELITHWILMALDCFLNVSLYESYQVWQGGERERKQGLPVERHAGRAGCREASRRERVAGWSVTGAHGGRWGGMREEGRE